MDESSEKLRAFLGSTDFMRLGYAIQSKNQQSAVMIINGMQRQLSEAGSEIFARELISIKQCVINNATHEAEDILAVMTAKRVQLQKQYGDV